VAIAPWAKLKMPDVLYVRTSPVPARPYIDPVVMPLMMNGKRVFTAHSL
jgi:hypothetical protein